jgi:hypothetical protein
VQYNQQQPLEQPLLECLFPLVIHLHNLVFLGSFNQDLLDNDEPHMLFMCLLTIVLLIQLSSMASLKGIEDSIHQKYIIFLLDLQEQLDFHHTLQ